MKKVSKTKLKYENEQIRMFVFIHQRLIDCSKMAIDLGVSQVLIHYIINGKRADYYNVLITAENKIKAKLKELSIVK